MQVIDNLRCYMNITSHRPMSCTRAAHSKRSTPSFRASAHRNVLRHGVVRQFEMMGRYPANESQAITRSRDKLRCLQLLARKGHRGCRHGVRPFTKDVEGLINIVGGAPSW